MRGVTVSRISTPQQTRAIDYYQEFGFKRKESTDQLRQGVERVQRQWRRRASLTTKDGEEASDSLSLLA